MASVYALGACKGNAVHLYVAAVGVERPVRIKRDQLQALRRCVHLRAPRASYGQHSQLRWA